MVAGGRGGECTDMSTHSNTEEVKRREEWVCRVCVLCVCVFMRLGRTSLASRWHWPGERGA